MLHRCSRRACEAPSVEGHLKIDRWCSVLGSRPRWMAGNDPRVLPAGVLCEESRQAKRKPTCFKDCFATSPPLEPCPNAGRPCSAHGAQLPAQAAKPSLATQLLVRAEQEIQNKGKHAKSPPNSSTTSLAAISWSSLSYTRVPVLVRLCCTLPVAKKMGAQGWGVAKLPVIPDSVD